MSKKKNKDIIDFEYTVADDFKVIYSNGAIGGPDTFGQIRFDFYYEYRTLPDKITHEMVGMKLGDEISRTPKKERYIRERKVGIILTPEKAISIGEWLIDQANIVARVKEEHK